MTSLRRARECVWIQLSRRDSIERTLKGEGEWGD